VAQIWSAEVLQAFSVTKYTPCFDANPKAYTHIAAMRAQMKIKIARTQGRFFGSAATSVSIPVSISRPALN
jgi:hypothetical protein